MASRRLTACDNILDHQQTDLVGRVARITNNVVTYLHPDHLGSAQAGTNASGAIAWREQYTPFGETIQRPPANDNQAGYTGHIQDQATGLTYMQARYYDPGIGRFLSVDPVDPVGSSGYDLNLYAYVGNDPLNKTDPKGTYECSGSKENCSAVAAGLKRAKDAYGKMADGADKNRLGKVLDAYGQAGEKNGVNVSFSKDVQYGQAERQTDGSISVAFNSDFSQFGAGWSGAVTTDVQAGVLAHEGSHGVDARAIGRNPRNKQEALATERKAYKLQSKVHEALKSVSVPKIWDPSWPANEAESMRNAAIEANAQNSASGWPE